MPSVRFTLPADALGTPFAAGESNPLLDELRSIPGVRVRGRWITCSPDVAPFAAAAAGIAQTTLAGTPPLVPSPDGALVPGWSTLAPYQQEGASALASGARRGLWWSTGVGKTRTALAAIELVRANRALIVTRGIGRDAWVRDSAHVGRRRVAVLIGTGPNDSALAAARRGDRYLADLRTTGADCFATADAATAIAGASIVVVGWEVLAARAEALAAPGWPALVLDESHLGKSRLADRSKAAFRLRDASARTWILTATPIPDRMRDLWAQLAYIAPDAWSTSWKFVHRYCHAEPGRYGGLDTTGPHPPGQCPRCASTTAELKARCNYWFDVLTRSTIASFLPPKRRVVRRIPSDVVAKAPSGRAFAPSDRGIEAALGHAAAGKIAAVSDLAAEVLTGGGKVVVTGNRIAWVARAATAIERAVRVRSVRERLWLRAVSGRDVPVSERQALAREYQALAGPACLVATADSIMECMDLQQTDALIVAALPWTPRQVTQLEGRVSRRGGRPVTIYYPIAEGTIDERVEHLLIAKLDSVDRAGADTEGGSFSDVEGMPTEAEVVAGLTAWLAESAARTEAA